MRILLIEDDDRIAKPLAEDLKHQQYVVDIAGDGLAGWQYSQSAAYDLLLLDLMLPKLDGISLCKRLRSSGFRGFILMLTAKDKTSDKVVGLDSGADDYLVKPFKPQELSARIRALLRRPCELRQPVLRCGHLVLDPATHRTSFADKALELTPKEYLLLEHFMQRPGQVFSLAQLLDRLWELDRVSGEHTVRTHLTNLRKKLKAAGCQSQPIETVYGVGYRLRAPAS